MVVGARQCDTQLIVALVARFDSSPAEIVRREWLTNHKLSAEITG